MSNYEDFQDFQDGFTASAMGQKEYLKDIENKLNDDLSEWDLVMVPIKREFVDELTEIIEYEWRYRLYVSKVCKMLGFDSFAADRYSGYYWEKDKDGNITDYHLPTMKRIRA